MPEDKLTRGKLYDIIITGICILLSVWRRLMSRPPGVIKNIYVVFFFFFFPVTSLRDRKVVIVVLSAQLNNRLNSQDSM